MIRKDLITVKCYGIYIEIIHKIGCKVLIIHNVCKVFSQST